MDYTIALEPNPAREDLDVIVAGLGAYNEQFVPPARVVPLTLFVRDSDKTVIGGPIAGTFQGWLYIELFWLAESTRHQGIGTTLLQMAEQEAVLRGCHHAFLDTTSYQAQAFYEKHGYTVYGVLEDFPVGHSRIWMKKQLTQ